MSRTAPVLVLIGCSKRKLDRPAPCREFYQGTIFKCSVRWAELMRYQWVVISTKYGVVKPDEVIAPYDATFSTATTTPAGKVTSSWAAKVANALREFTGFKIISLLGGAYETAIGPQPEREKPCTGLSLGPRVQFLQRKIKEVEQQRNDHLH